MNIKSINYKSASEIVKYKDVVFRSLLEARWAAFFDETIYKWEYEPKSAFNYFDNWLPDFAVWVKEGEPPIYCEVKPINLKELPQDIKDKVAECDKVDETIVGILGKDPCVCRNPMSMGWISKRRNEHREWIHWTVNDMCRVKIIWDNTTKHFNRMSSTMDAIANLANQVAWETKDPQSEFKKLAQSWLKESNRLKEGADV